MVRFVRQLLKKQKKAKKLVKQAEKTLKRNHYEKAAEAVRELDRSSLKKDLKKQLKDILKAIREAEAAAVTPTPTAAPTATGSTLTPTVSPTGTDPSWIPTPIPAVTGTVLKKHTGNTVTVTGPATELTELEQEKAAYFRTHSIKKLKCKKTVEKKVRLTWKKQFGADYYTVYRSENKADNYREIGTTKKHKFKDERAKKRKTYFYRIQSHMTIRESSFTSKKSKAAKVYVQPEKPVTVIAGDCFVVDMVNLNSVYNGNHHFVAKIGVNTYTMMHNNYFEYQGQTITGIERIAYYKPDRVYYLIGANESAWATPSWTMDNYKTMRSLLKKINSHVEIILVQIPPFGYSSSQNIPSVSSRNAFNDSYQKMADKYKDVYYCPATDVLDDGTSHLMKQYDAGDGCHWNTNGTIAVSKEIKKWSKNTFHNW